MATDFKEIMYDKYVETHTNPNAKNITLSVIEQIFPTWKHFYYKHLPENKSANILDIGCGNGGFVHWLNTLKYTNTLGVDLSFQQIEMGRKIGISNIRCSDMFDILNECPGSFDLIIARDILEHFKKETIIEILQLIHKALKAGGKILIQVPNGMGIFYTEVFFGDFTHEMAFTESSLGQVLRNTNYSSFACYPVDPAPITIKSTVRFVLWKSFVRLIKFLKSLETGYSKGIFTRNIICCAVK